MKQVIDIGAILKYQPRKNIRTIWVTLAICMNLFVLYQFVIPDWYNFSLDVIWYVLWMASFLCVPLFALSAIVLPIFIAVKTLRRTPRDYQRGTDNLHIVDGAGERKLRSALILLPLLESGSTIALFAGLANLLWYIYETLGLPPHALGFCGDVMNGYAYECGYSRQEWEQPFSFALLTMFWLVGLSALGAAIGVLLSPLWPKVSPKIKDALVALAFMLLGVITLWGIYTLTSRLPHNHGEVLVDTMIMPSQMGQLIPLAVLPLLITAYLWFCMMADTISVQKR